VDSLPADTATATNCSLVCGKIVVFVVKKKIAINYSLFFYKSAWEAPVTKHRFNHKNKRAATLLLQRKDRKHRILENWHQWPLAFCAFVQPLVRTYVENSGHLDSNNFL